jgi:hypothetical protein
LASILFESRIDEGGNLHGTDDRTTPNTSDVAAQAGLNDDTDDLHDMPVNMDFAP